MIWFTADTHYGHHNIASRLTTQWQDKTRVRDFISLEVHNKTLVNNINSLVAQDDTLYHLGNWSLGGIENVWKFRSEINCDNIHLVMGNHDKYMKINPIIPEHQLEEVYDYFGWMQVSYGPFIRDLFLSVSDYLELYLHGRMIVLSHYPFEIWNKSHLDAIHLHGHCYGRCSKPNRIDVGVDSNNFLPVSLSDVLSVSMIN